ncbi:Fur family transcriptional regulator [Candidatus Uabimicrobium amorphum]|uniref:Ferric uptake regulation protein FurA n=1 Tax=Uabimicrobium amorphum TaxID=2596890 RepID=A0A5S9F6G9_UABAM|nr:transcriptional repressor [Candidatus Uabimicrobium amorphum]BBM87183.1 Ferric uptake regulation protein FurA [Candidatus Uabimicrobium amorphum]
MNKHRTLLKHHKLSLTAVRLGVLEALDAQPHSSVEEIFAVVKDKIVTTSKQAIYNNLNTLVKHGIIREIKPKGEPSRYETRVGDNHHHLICRECHMIVDTDCFSGAPCLEPMDDHGFNVDEAEILFWGICPSCQNNTNKEGSKDE